MIGVTFEQQNSPRRRRGAEKKPEKTPESAEEAEGAEVRLHGGAGVLIRF